MENDKSINSYKIGVKVENDNAWCFINCLRFDDEQSASEYAGDIRIRFHNEVDVRVFPSSDKPNCFRRKAG